MLPPSWNDWEGHRIAGEYPLLRILGGSAHSAVFLTERHGAKAAIKIVPADAVQAYRLQQRWEQAAQLKHPNLLPLYETGEDEIGGVHTAYLLMELADDDLSRLDRPLTEQEARDVLANALPAIAYLREQGFVHGAIQPSNIMAAGDRLLLSADTVRPVGEGASHADDMWALGATMRQVLGEVPMGLREAIDKCLIEDSRKRATDGDVAYMLRVSALSPAAKPPSRVPWKYLAVGATGLLAVAGVVYVPELWIDPPMVDTAPPAPLLKAPEKPTPPSETAETVAKIEPEAETQSPVPVATPVVTPPPAIVAAKAEAPKVEAVKPELAKPEPAKPQPVKPEPAKPATKATPGPSPETATERAPQETTASAPARQAILKQVLPDVPAAARETIRGRVIIRVRAFVDSSGAVIVATNQSPNASSYFGNMAVDAAKQWQFAPPPPDGPQSNAWTLEFEFRPNAARPVTVQATPALR